MTTLKQVSLLAGLSLLLGVLRNVMLDEPLDWIKQPRALTEITINNDDTTQAAFMLPEFLTEPMLIKYIAVFYLYNENNAVFIDARESEEFDAGHIEGSLNIPYDYLEDFEYQLDGLDEETILVTYCGGGECDLSIDLADYLMNDRGFFNVLVYEGGWPEWQENLELLP